MILKIVAWTVVLLLTGCIGGAVMSYAWNQVFPVVFDLPRLSFWNGFWIFWFAQGWTGGIFVLIKAFMDDKA